MSTGLKANSDGSAAIQVGGTDVITLTSGGAATFVTSPTTVQAGTAAAPSITFSGDTNTGIYSPGADTVGLTAGGTLVGSVGLGTTLALQGATSQSGTGITFPATQSASSNANTLDDYEEGNWTPNDASGAGLSFGNVFGRYTKVGRIVFLTATLDYPSTANGANAIIGGLPFTITDVGGGYSQYTTAAAGAIAFRNLGGTTGGAALLVTNGTNTDSPLTNANLSGAVIQIFFFGIV